MNATALGTLTAFFGGDKCPGTPKNGGARFYCAHPPFHNYQPCAVVGFGAKVTQANKNTPADLEISCPDSIVNGTVVPNTITSVMFASFGRSTGNCADGRTKTACHSSDSQTKVEALCKGKSSCTIPAGPSTFTAFNTSDPATQAACGITGLDWYATLAVQVNCTGAPDSKKK